LVRLRSECTSITTEFRSSTAAEAETVAGAVEYFVRHGNVDILDTKGAAGVKLPRVQGNRKLLLTASRR